MAGLEQPARRLAPKSLTPAEVAEAMGVSQQRVSAIESGAVAELATLGDCIRALGGGTESRRLRRLLAPRGLTPAACIKQAARY